MRPALKLCCEKSHFLIGLRAEYKYVHIVADALVDDGAYGTADYNGNPRLPEDMSSAIFIGADGCQG